jgi:hypothetical protein
MSKTSETTWLLVSALVVSLGLASRVEAQTRAVRPYLTVQGGGNVLLPTDVDGTLGEGDARFTAGWDAGGAIGLRFFERWRLEAELTYRTTKLRDADVPELGAFGAGGFSSLSIAVNALAQFQPFERDELRVFIGFGAVWIQEIDIDFQRDGEGEVSFEDFSRPGLQSIVGLRYQPVERFFLEGSVRVLRAFDVDLTSSTREGERLDLGYDVVALTLGVGVEI